MATRVDPHRVVNLWIEAAGQVLGPDFSGQLQTRGEYQIARAQEARHGRDVGIAGPHDEWLAGGSRRPRFEEIPLLGAHLSDSCWLYHDEIGAIEDAVVDLLRTSLIEHRQCSALGRVGHQRGDHYRPHTRPRVCGFRGLLQLSMRRSCGALIVLGFVLASQGLEPSAEGAAFAPFRLEEPVYTLCTFLCSAAPELSTICQLFESPFRLPSPGAFVSQLLVDEVLALLVGHVERLTVECRDERVRLFCDGFNRGA